MLRQNEVAMTDQRGVCDEDKEPEISRADVRRAFALVAWLKSLFDGSKSLVLTDIGKGDGNDIEFTTADGLVYVMPGLIEADLLLMNADMRPDSVPIEERVDVNPNGTLGAEQKAAVEAFLAKVYG